MTIYFFSSTAKRQSGPRSKTNGAKTSISPTCKSAIFTATSLVAFPSANRVRRIGRSSSTTTTVGSHEHQYSSPLFSKKSWTLRRLCILFPNETDNRPSQYVMHSAKASTCRLMAHVRINGILILAALPFILLVQCPCPHSRNIQRHCTVVR